MNTTHTYIIVRVVDYHTAQLMGGKKEHLKHYFINAQEQENRIAQIRHEWLYSHEGYWLKKGLEEKDIHVFEYYGEPEEALDSFLKHIIKIIWKDTDIGQFIATYIRIFNINISNSSEIITELI